MNPDRPIFEKLGKRVGLAAAAALAMWQVACAKTEPIRTQAPSPSQGVTTELVPTSAPEPLPVEKSQEIPQIEGCQPTDIMGPITMKGPGGRDVPIGSIKALDERDLRTGPTPAASTFKKVPAGTDLIIMCTNASQGSMLVQIPNQQISGWVQRIPEIEPLLRTVAPKIPEPTPVPELPRFLRETPVYGVYTGAIMTEPGGEGVVGESLFSHLPDDRVLASFVRFKPCPDGSPITPVFLVTPNVIRGGGFQHEYPQTNLVALLQGQTHIGGELTIKDFDRQGTVCKGNLKLSISAPLLQERGKEVLLNRLTAMLRKADSRNTLEVVTRMVETLYGRPLPEESAK